MEVQKHALLLAQLVVAFTALPAVGEPGTPHTRPSHGNVWAAGDLVPRYRYRPLGHQCDRQDTARACDDPRYCRSTDIMDCNAIYKN